MSSAPAGKTFFADLTWVEAERLLEGRRRPVLLLPVGATEAHGPHAPLGTDPLISLGMCRRAADRLRDDPDLRALILPAVSYAVTRYAAGFPGTIHVQEATLQALLVDVCAHLIERGFRHLVVVNSHFEPEHVATIHRGLDLVEERTGAVVGFVDLTRKERALALTEEFRRLGSHAGRYETALVLADRPDLIDEVVRARLEPVDVDLVAAIGQGLEEFRAMGLTRAYNGAPAEATAEEGREVFEVLTDMLVQAMRDLVAGTGGRDRPGFYARRGAPR
jgi:creatinine amidohydrolase